MKRKYTILRQITSRKFGENRMETIKVESNLDRANLSIIYQKINFPRERFSSRYKQSPLDRIRRLSSRRVHHSWRLRENWYTCATNCARRVLAFRSYSLLFFEIFLFSFQQEEQDVCRIEVLYLIHRARGALVSSTHIADSDNTRAHANRQKVWWTRE